MACICREGCLPDLGLMLRRSSARRKQERLAKVDELAQAVPLENMGDSEEQQATHPLFARKRPEPSHPLFAKQRTLQRVGGEEWAREKIKTSANQKEIAGLMRSFRSSANIQEEGCEALRALAMNSASVAEAAKGGMQVVLQAMATQLARASARPLEQYSSDTCSTDNSSDGGTMASRAAVEALLNKVGGVGKRGGRADFLDWAHAWKLQHLERPESAALPNVDSYETPQTTRRVRRKDLQMKALSPSSSEEVDDMSSQEELELLHSDSDPYLLLGRGASPLCNSSSSTEDGVLC
ncbi:hypothetical protein T484DRAFT_2483893 [Baffinella frigidus]|nr:hypothetical protein T484DRAFT_2483893 [Cryptophyta sp. CCMP2293]